MKRNMFDRLEQICDVVIDYWYTVLVALLLTVTLPIWIIPYLIKRKKEHPK